METVAKKKPRARRSFTPEFKAEIVERCQAGDRTVAQVARDFDLAETAVRKWVRQAEIDAGQRDGLTSDERQELAQLRRENRRLQADVDLLKRATAFFEGDPVKMDPFIEAEEAAGRSVKHCCDMFQVSRAAYYQRKKQTPSARAVADGELVEQIRQVHDDSDGTYGHRGCTGSCSTGARFAAAGGYAV